jgi:hypothetical protein
MLQATIDFLFMQHEFAAVGDIVLLHGQMRAINRKTSKVHDDGYRIPSVSAMARSWNGRLASTVSATCSK